MIASIDVLIYQSILILILGFLFCLYALRMNLGISAFVSVFKSSSFFLYFKFYFNPEWTHVDDLTYYQNAASLLDQNWTFISIIKKPLVDQIIMFGGSKHILYDLFNVASQQILGSYYHSAICINIIITFLIVFIWKLIVKSVFDDTKTIMMFCVFSLLHWDLWAWSTFVNLKDTLVLLLTSVGLLSLVYLTNKNRLLGATLMTISILGLLLLRFYIPLFFIISYCVYFMLNVWIRTRRSSKIFILIICFGAMLLGMAGIQVIFTKELSIFASKLSLPIIGIPRYLITPIPINVQHEYYFLLFPSIFHFLLAPLAAWGFYSLLCNSPKHIKLLVIYFLIMVCFYGTFSELQGPRHRVQLLFFISLYQFIGLYNLVKYTLSQLKGHS